MESKARPAPAKDVDAYIAAAPASMRAPMRKLRRVIKAAAPKATEAISYRVPVYMYEGMLVGFAAFKEHYSFFVMSPLVMKQFAKELEGYSVSVATVRVPADDPLPDGLVKKLVKTRVKENEERARKRAEKKAKARRAKPGR